MASEDREGQFFKGVAHGSSVTCQWMAPHPDVYGQHTLALMAYKNNFVKKRT